MLEGRVAGLESALRSLPAEVAHGLDVGSLLEGEGDESITRMKDAVQMLEQLRVADRVREADNAGADDVPDGSSGSTLQGVSPPVLLPSPG